MPSRVREERKPPIDRDTILLPDGTTISQSAFQRLRSCSHQKFTEPAGLGARIEHAVRPAEWRALLAWMDMHRSRHGSRERQNDNFLAVLIDICSQRTRLSVDKVLGDIIRFGTAGMLLPQIQ